MTTQVQRTGRFFGIPLWLGLSLLGAMAVFFLLEEHRAHLLGAGVYLLLLACPLIHILTHRSGHGH
jgi:hypothetical protein